MCLEVISSTIIEVSLLKCLTNGPSIRTQTTTIATSNKGHLMFFNIFDKSKDNFSAFSLASFSLKLSISFLRATISELGQKFVWMNSLNSSFTIELFKSASKSFFWRCKAEVKALLWFFWLICVSKGSSQNVQLESFEFCWQKIKPQLKQFL